MNTFGDHFTFTSFGESHSAAIGGVIDGLPAGLHIDLEMIREALDRRAGRTTDVPGVSSRARNEADDIEWLSGVLDGVTLGTPVAFLIRNTNHRPADYEAFKHTCRPAHADTTYLAKYGLRDWRGGGRASARETASRVVAGTLAQQMLQQRGITITAQLTQVGAAVRKEDFAAEIERYRLQGDSIGGIVCCEVKGLPAGLGEPIFDKLQARLAYAIMSINACKGFDYGSGFAGVTQPGEVANASSGGILGGITDGTTLTFRCVFKPTPSTPKMFARLEEAGMLACGTVNRSDACVAIRAVPVVQAMTALTLADFLQETSSACHC